MTAKLPPPPMLRGFPDESGEEWFTKRQLEDALKSHALQAVRDALERLKKELDPIFCSDGFVVSSIETLLKEYEQ